MLIVILIIVFAINCWAIYERVTFMKEYNKFLEQQEQIREIERKYNEMMKQWTK